MAAVFPADGSTSYVRGIARCDTSGVAIDVGNGVTYYMPNEWVDRSILVDEDARAAAPPEFGALLTGVRCVLPVPPPGENFAMARTPNWKATLKPDR